MAISLPSAPRILIVMMSAVGDTVHALPVVTALRRRYPDAKISWVLQPGPATLVRGHPDIDEIILFQRRSGWRAFGEVRRELRAREFDIVVDLQVYFKASIVTAMARAPIKLGFDRARARDLNWLVTNRKVPAAAPKHVQEQYFEFLQHLGVPAEPVQWNLGPWPHERERQREMMMEYPAPVVPLVIGSSDPTREWPADRWAALHDALIEDYGLRPVIAGGRSPRELEAEERIRAASRHDLRSTLGIPFRELVALIDASALIISLNTAPLHISVAVGTPAIMLASKLNPKRTGPFRAYHDLIVDAYGRPGEEYPVTNEKRPSRMEEITVDDVLEKVELWRVRYAGRREGDGVPDPEDGTASNAKRRSEHPLDDDD